VHRTILFAVAFAIALLTAPAAQADDVRPPGLLRPFGDEKLSNERTVTRWAQVLFPGTIYRKPWVASPAVGRLHRLTEDHEFEIYLVLESHVDSIGQTWMRVRIPKRPNGNTGWVKAEHLGGLTVVRTLLRVNRRTQRAQLYKRGRIIWSSPIGVGKRGTPTPKGHFYVRELLSNLGGNGLYGPYAFGTSAYSVLSDWPGGGVVGIHGTNQPQLIPGRPSHGCIRVPNANIRRLVKLMPLGTPVHII
jgi:hypothetical protein